MPTTKATPAKPVDADLIVLVIHRRGCRVISEELEPAWYLPGAALILDPQHGMLLQARCNDPACPAVVGMPLRPLQDRLLAIAEELSVDEASDGDDGHLRTDTCRGCGRQVGWNGFGWVAQATGIECEASADGLHHGTQDDEEPEQVRPEPEAGDDPALGG